MRPVLPAILCAALVASAGHAQPEAGRRPRAAGRLAHFFDFEEKDSNPGEVPRDWYRNQDDPSAGTLREGFPSWNKAALSYVSEGGAAMRGDGSAMLPTRGGGTSLVVGVGVIPVFADTEYRIAGFVRTQDLRHAGAAIVTRLLDSAGVQIPGSARATEFATSEGRWRELALETSTVPNAAYLELELVLLQPRQVEAFYREEGLQRPHPGADAPFLIHREDRAGAAWFDDISVLQLPRVEVTTGAPGNIVPPNATPSLDVTVRDMANEPVNATLVVQDAWGREVDRVEERIEGAASRRLTPRLARRGWFRAKLTLRTGDGQNVGGAAVDFVWLPERVVASDDTGARDAHRFGLQLSSLPPDQHAMLAPTAAALGAGSVTLPLWTPDLTQPNVRRRTETVQSLISGLLAKGVRAHVAVGPVPDDTARQRLIDRDDSWSLLASRDAEAWRPLLQDALDRIGAKIDGWQIGLAPAGPGLARHPSRGALARVAEALATSLPGLELRVPTDIRQKWDARELLSTNTETTLLAHIPADLSPQAVRWARGPWSPIAAASPRTLGLDCILDGSDAYDAGHPVRSASRLVKQAVECWRILGEDTSPQGSARVSLSLADPWRWPTRTRETASPAARLAAWTALRERLSGRRVAAEFGQNPGVVCYVLAPLDEYGVDAPGAIVAWNEGAEPGQAYVDVPLGTGEPLVYDLFGNPTPAPAPTATPSNTRVVRVPVGDEPVFVEGVDAGLARFVSLISITPPTLDAGAGVGEHEVVLRNPWRVGINGAVRILEPGGLATGQKDRTWRITPRLSPFSLGPGQEARLPISVAFKPNEEAGPKEFVMAVEVSGDGRPRTVEVRRTLDLGVKDIRLEVAASRLNEAGDLLLEAAVSNTGPRALTLELTGIVPGEPRARGSIANLAPGAQAIRRFTFPGKARALAGQRAAVSLVDAETGARLLRTAAIGD
ncbi:MAG TPA: hypothetical protein VD971_12035 [Phycisphaerales bacterium]|nr:hypothetical protein [Phycisphaerales bacterium]